MQLLHVLLTSFLSSVQNGFQLFVQVLDEDYGFDDYVDFIYINMPINPSTTGQPLSYNVQGEFGNARIDVTVMVQCDENFIGDDCNTSE